MIESQLPAGLVFKETFYFVFNGNLYKIPKGPSAIHWINKSMIGQPSSVPLRTHDNLILLRESIYTVASDNNLWAYDINSQNWTNHNKPSSSISCLSPAGAKMFEHTIFIVGSDENLYSYSIATNAWNNLSNPSNNYRLNEYSLALTLKDETLFIIGYKQAFFGLKTRLYELSTNGVSHSWTNHGRPAKSCISLGASMLGTKMFLGGINGKVYERIWDGSNWNWVNHGKIAFNSTNSNLFSHPQKIYDDKFFITAYDPLGELHERWWDGGTSSWNWNNNHGRPTIPLNCKIMSGPTYSNEYPDRMFAIAKDTASNDYLIFSRYWDGTSWQYFNHGVI